MTLSPGDGPEATARQRTREQFELLREAHPTSIITDSEDPADFTYICSGEDFLVNTEDLARVQEYFGGRLLPDDGGAEQSDRDDGGDRGDGDGDGDDGQQARRVFTDIGNTDVPQPRDALFVRYVAPTRFDAVPGDRSILTTLAELDRDLEPGLVRPNHVVHICPKGSLCPATEPTETGLADPWPPVAPSDHDVPPPGTGATVVVIDTGWYEPKGVSLPWPWLADVTGDPEPGGVFRTGDEIRPYSGHGTFVAGVVRAMAPGCTLHVLSLPVDPATPGGGVLESDMVPLLDAALTHDPDLINLSAGCPTRDGHPARAFENWWADVSAKGLDVVLVASAGNNASPWPFWPASFDWAVGVGSLDRDGEVSDFSNWGDSADVFALGRNVVNAFPNGTYLCHEAPDLNDVRVFDRWLARWSGTSFSAPLVTGLIAAEVGRQTGPHDVAAARDAVLAATTESRPSLTARTAPVLGAELLAVPHQGP